MFAGALGTRCAILFRLITLAASAVVASGQSTEATIAGHIIDARSGKPIEEAATALSQAAEIGAAREAFGRLSDAVIAYADNTRTSPGGDVATVYCPMVKKSWLQKNGEVKNPYFGKAMPSCGEKKKVG